MKTPLVDVSIPSIYMKGGVRMPVPRRMARCTPDTYLALQLLGRKVEALGGRLYLSDLFRSHDMQLQAHLDWKSKKKSAFSPPPGGSLHEAGRAFDLDLDALKVGLGKFWDEAADQGVTPVIATPSTRLKEAWHFDCRGSHDLVYRYYKQGFGTNFQSAYAAMAASAILAIGQPVDHFGSRQTEAAIQAGLVRLGHRLGNIDGNIGAKTRQALADAGVGDGTLADTLVAVEHLLQARFPAEYTIAQRLDLEALGDDVVPEHLVA